MVVGFLVLVLGGYFVVWVCLVCVWVCCSCWVWFWVFGFDLDYLVLGVGLGWCIWWLSPWIWIGGFSGVLFGLVG